MTKRVRIENADAADSHRVVVQEWQRADVRGQPDRLVAEHILSTPTQLLELAVYDGHYLVVREGL